MKQPNLHPLILLPSPISQKKRSSCLRQILGGGWKEIVIQALKKLINVLLVNVSGTI